MPAGSGLICVCLSVKQRLMSVGSKVVRFILFRSLQYRLRNGKNAFTVSLDHVLSPEANSVWSYPTCSDSSFGTDSDVLLKSERENAAE